MKQNSGDSLNQVPGVSPNYMSGNSLNLKRGFSLDHRSDVGLDQESDKKDGPDFSLYVLVMIASVVISLVLFLLFGTNSIKVSILINLAGLAFIAICEMHRKREDEEDEADRAMSVFMKEPVLNEQVLREPVLREQVLREPVPEKEKVIVESINPVGEVIHSEDEYIETSVLTETTEGVSKLISKGKKLAEDISIPEGRLRIGRLGSVCEYCIDEPEISRVHAVLEKRGNTVTLKDMDSTNGTYVNDRRINGTESVELSQGDIISMADIKYECL